MNSIQMQAIISPTRELTIKLPTEMSPGTPVLVLITPVLTSPMRLETAPVARTDTPHPSWSQEYLNEVLGGWVGEPPWHFEPLPLEERQPW
jgi:hypothetical protein